MSMPNAQESTGQAAQSDEPQAPAPAAEKPADELGEGGKKALQTERDARRALEGDVGRIKAALAALGGVDAKKSSIEDLIQAQSARIAAMEHETAAMTTIAAHRITDQADIDLIRSQPTPDAMSALAARLAPASGAEPKGPKPDPSVGRGGQSSEKATGTVASGRDLYAEVHGIKNI